MERKRSLQDLLSSGSEWAVSEYKTTSNGDLDVIFTNKLDKDQTFTLSNVNAEHFLKLWREDSSSGGDPAPNCYSNNMDVDYLTGDQEMVEDTKHSCDGLEPFVQSHEEILSLYQQFSRSSEVEEKRHMIELLIQSITRYFLVERYVLCPLVANLLREDVISQSDIILSQNNVLETCNSLKNTDPCDYNYKEICDALMVDMRWHIEKIERSVLPVIESKFSKEQMAQCCLLIQHANKMSNCLHGTATQALQDIEEQVVKLACVQKM